MQDKMEEQMPQDDVVITQKCEFTEEELSIMVAGIGYIPTTINSPDFAKLMNLHRKIIDKIKYQKACRPK